MGRNNQDNQDDGTVEDDNYDNTDGTDNPSDEDAAEALSGGHPKSQPPTTSPYADGAQTAGDNS